MASNLAATRKPGTGYTDAQKQDALILYLALGSLSAASDRTGVSRETLAKWRDADPQRMDNLRENYKAQLDKYATNTLRAQNTEMLSIRQQLIDRMKQEIMDLSPDRIPEAIGRITLAYAQGFDKLRLAEGNPTSINEVRPVADIAKELEEVLKKADVDSTAIEDTEKAT